MSELTGNLLVAQSGGPTAVINASLAGVIQEAGKYPDVIEEIYGGLNGVLGILNEDIVDLQEERSAGIEGLKHTPAAALGSCRYKLDFKKKPERAAKDLDRLFQIFEAHNIRFFFYIGGNDSQDTAAKVHEQSIQRGFPMRVIGVPKTIDNDLPFTDHCPGYGSVIRYNAATVMEVATDVASMATDDGSCCIIEVMGRAAGWIAAGTVLAKRSAQDAPHIILVPEIRFQAEAFLAKVKETIGALGTCVVVVGEGLKDQEGKEMGADSRHLDAFGHTVLSGVAEVLGQLVNGKLKTKTRTVKLGYAQRAAAHLASATDVAEAIGCGEAAVRAVVAGESGRMVKIVRLKNDPYTWRTELHDVREVANVERLLPREWMDADGFMPNEEFVKYARPLIDGVNTIPMEGGLPKFSSLQRVRIEKKLPPRPS